MNTKQLFLISFFSFFAMLFSAAFVSTSAGDPWVVPDKYKKMKNPVKSDAESIATGKALYVKHCKSCHGSKGLGDGPKAAQLKTECGDFSKADFQSQSDGSIFYKTSEGRKDMPSFKKKIPDETDMWSVVNYMRTLKK
jgi:mono/diheme cytochrome c family protein